MRSRKTRRQIEGLETVLYFCPAESLIFIQESVLTEIRVHGGVTRKGFSYEICGFHGAKSRTHEQTPGTELKVRKPVPGSPGLFTPPQSQRRIVGSGCSRVFFGFAMSYYVDVHRKAVYCIHVPGSRPVPCTGTPDSL